MFAAILDANTLWPSVLGDSLAHLRKVLPGVAAVSVDPEGSVTLSGVAGDWLLSGFRQP